MLICALWRGQPMQQRCPGRVLVVDCRLTVRDCWSGNKDPFGLWRDGDRCGAIGTRTCSSGGTPVLRDGVDS